MAKDRHDELALALAQRYLGPEPGKSVHEQLPLVAGDGGEVRDAAAIVAFITENRSFLFFTDTGGYRWMVDANAKRAAAQTAPAKARRASGTAGRGVR